MSTSCDVKFSYLKVSGKSIDIITKGIQYTGTKIRTGIPGIIAILDPFEVSFVAQSFIEVNNVSSCEKDQLIKSCVNPIPIFRAILQSLFKKPVLLQVQTIFIQGLVQKIEKHDQTVRLLVSAKEISTIRLQDLVAVLVPLLVAPQVKFGNFGDPTTYTLNLHNQTPSTAHIEVFQTPS